MSGINVKEVLDQNVVRATRQYVEERQPRAGEFYGRCLNLKDMAERITCMASCDDCMPVELRHHYNELIEMMYEVSDLEYALYKSYR